MFARLNFPLIRSGLFADSTFIKPCTHARSFVRSFYSFHTILKLDPEVCRFVGIEQHNATPLMHIRCVQERGCKCSVTLTQVCISIRVSPTPPHQRALSSFEPTASIARGNVFDVITLRYRQHYENRSERRCNRPLGVAFCQSMRRAESRRVFPLCVFLHC